MMSIPYMFYNIPIMYPWTAYIYYNMNSILFELYTQWIIIPRYFYYKSYIDLLLYTHDILLIQNSFVLPLPLNRDYLPLNMYHKLLLYNKYNPGRSSLKLWKVKYDYSHYMPKHLETWFYFIKYQVYENYLKIYHGGKDSYTKGLSKSSFRVLQIIRENYTEFANGGKGNIDVIYSAILFFALICFCTTIQYSFEQRVVQDLYPNLDIDIWTEDRIDWNFGSPDSFEFETEALESEIGETNFFSVTEPWPEAEVWPEEYEDADDAFNINYIKTEAEFEQKFNDFLCKENQKDIYNSLSVHGKRN